MRVMATILQQPPRAALRNRSSLVNPSAISTLLPAVFTVSSDGNILGLNPNDMTVQGSTAARDLVSPSGDNLTGLTDGKTIVTLRPPYLHVLTRSSASSYSLRNSPERTISLPEIGPGSPPSNPLSEVGSS